MKRIILLALGFFSFSANAQVSFTDDFEAYTVGSPLGPQSPNWTTWSGTQGGADDINVTNTGAHSGTKSLYFSSTAASGGPSDIVLPFSGPHTTGTFTFKTWFKVQSGKGGYFNFQGTNTPGQVFCLNTFFNSNGTLEIQNAKEVVLNNTFSQNVWFEFKLVANLNTNSWEAFIDNVSKGTFQLSDFSIASIDYYATSTTDAFWVDDVSFDYVPYTLPTRNGAVSYWTVNNGLVTQTRFPDLKIRNLGTTAINSFTISVNANGTITNQNFTGLTIASGAAYTAVLTNPVTFINGLNTVTATISNVNGSGADNDAADDSKTFTFTPVMPGSDKVVVAEEGTGTWCQWCPRGAVAMDAMTTDFDGFFQGIAVHNGDPMVVNSYDSVMGTKINGYPSALVDRMTDIDPLAIKQDFLTRIVLTPVAKLKNGANYNSANGQLDVSVTTTFKSNASGNYRIACVLVEDSVKGTTAQYNQANAYAGGANGVMGGFETKPNPVPASQMRYDHVARAIAPDFFGIPNAYPSSVTTGSMYTHNFSFNIAAWNKNKMHIVALLIAPDGKIENAGSSTIDQAIANGYVLNVKDKIITPTQLSVYPNPASEEINLQVNAIQFDEVDITVRDIQGKVCMTQQTQLYSGVNKFPISLQHIPSGQYIISLTGKHIQSSATFSKD